MTNQQEKVALIIKRKIQRLELKLNKFMNINLADKENRIKIRKVMFKIELLELKFVNALLAL